MAEGREIVNSCQRLVHGSDTITPLYPARYDDCPSTKFVFVLFLNAKTLILWTVDEERDTLADTPLQTPLISEPGISPVRKEAKVKAERHPS